MFLFQFLALLFHFIGLDVLTILLVFSVQIFLILLYKWLCLRCFHIWKFARLFVLRAMPPSSYLADRVNSTRYLRIRLNMFLCHFPHSFRGYYRFACLV